MNTGILIIAHAPLASALRAGVLHVFPEVGPAILALDVPPSEAPDVTREHALALLEQLGTPSTLVLTDVFVPPCEMSAPVFWSVGGVGGTCKLTLTVTIELAIVRHPSVNCRLIPADIAPRKRGNWRDGLGTCSCSRLATIPVPDHLCQSKWV